MKKFQKEIKSLASLNVDKYVRKTAGKCEENAKIKIVIPLLELLGYNSQRDMDFEHHVRNKRADIALLIDNKPRLLVETKDIDEPLDIHINQALNYAFNKGVEWVILTSGLEIRVYKSFIPNIPHRDRILFTTMLQNLCRSFDTLFELVGKEHLREARKLTEKAESVRESITVKTLIEDLALCRERLFGDLFSQFKIRYETDHKFKEIINAWATDVKMDISDPALIEKLCKEGAYTLINRVLFLRICEDKGHIRAKLSKDAITKWREMVENPSSLLDVAFKEIGERFKGLYKSPLFDSISFEDIDWNADTINFVLDKLGEHDFSKISKDILGKAYEQHISKEERKKLGQFYTPDSVIDYIIDQVGISPRKKILDPACGSGGFLMKAYDTLRKQYVKQGWAEEAVHEQILKDNLFGIDINPFATQLTAMNLLLKDLDHPATEFNVVEGDSLDKIYEGLDLDILKTKTPLAKVTGLDHRVSLVKLLREHPFDILISNPPYITVWGIDKKTKRYLQKNYKCAKGRFNMFTVFLERAIDLTCEGGKVGFVVPEGLLTHIEYQPIREYILSHCKILKIATMPKDTFAASVDVIVIILQKEKKPKSGRENLIEITLAKDSSSIAQAPKYNISQDLFVSNKYRMFLIFLTPELQPIYKKVHSQTVPLGELLEVQQGIIYSGLPRGKVFANSKLGKDYVKVLDGRDITRYQINYSLKAENRYLKYGKHLHRPREERLFLAPEKLLLQRKSFGLIGTYDDEQFYALNTVYILVSKKAEYEVTLKYLLALLNSSLMNWTYSKTWVGWQVTIPAIDILPIRVANTDTRRELERLVGNMLELSKRLNDPVLVDQQEAIQKEIDATDREINRKVYKLYGLTEREISVVERKV